MRRIGVACGQRAANERDEMRHFTYVGAKVSQ